jgi:uncharacterized protein YcbK (DUF882 family)
VRAACLTVTLLLGASASAAPKKVTPPAPAAELMQLNTHEIYKLRPDKQGRFKLPGWSRFLRCHHTGRRHLMSPRLAALLYEVSKHFDWKRIEIVAGYRAPRVAKEKGNPKSPHKQGLATDFRVRGVAQSEVRDYVRAAFDKVGVGWYPNSDFVHLDIRKKGTFFWIDYSGPGERARYSKNALGDLAEEKQAQPLIPPSIDEGGTEPQSSSSPGVSAPNAPALAPASN